MKVKGILAAAALLAAVILLQATCVAVNVDYSGPINSFTGEPSGENNSVQGDGRVIVASGIWYDWQEHAYIYDLGGVSGETISSNVMDGMIVTEPVRIEVPEGIDVRLHRSGNLVENADLTLIDVPGRYVLEARLPGDGYVRIMDFAVVGSTTGLINSYPMPAGFAITEVEMTAENEKGELVTVEPKWDRSKVSMSEAGNYYVKYECARNGLGYTLQTTIDHTPPTLALENVVNGLARGPVDISDLEEGCKISITLNGGKMSYREELTLSGDYEILLQDEAGNLTHYTFTILAYFDINSWIFFALVVLAIGGTGAYLYIERKRMRIR